MHAVTTHAGVCLENILLPTAFATTSKLVLRYGVAMAKHFGSTLHVVHVITPQDTAVPGYPVPMQYDSEVQLVEQNMATLLASTPLQDVPYEAWVEQGQLWPVLSDLCAGRGIDMVLLGTEGHGGITKLLYGSAAEEIIRSASCPVLTVGPNCPMPGNQEFTARQILCATDLLPNSDKVSAYAANFAQESGGSLTLLHAVESPDQDSRARAGRDLQQQLMRLRSQGDPALDVESLVEAGRAADAILRTAEVKHADLIVLGARHSDHPFLTAHITTTTIHRVLAHSTCPVLTLPTHAS